VLHYLAQSSSDAGGWTITTFIALAGAVLSAVTLIVTTIATGRRERAKWAREALAEAFYAFVDESYLLADLAKDHLDLLWAGADDLEVERSREVVRVQQDALRKTMTKIRLLAPRTTVDKATAVRHAHADMLAELTASTTESRYADLLRSTAAVRQHLMDSAKKAMALPR
jgi:hypothetical protein